MKLRSTWVIALIAASLVTRPEARQVQTPRLVFRAGVDYVRVDVVVTDGKDRPVTDLTKSDFEIVERGQTQTIDDFAFVSVPMPSRASTSRSESPAPPPDVATNAPPSPTSRLFVMVVDDLHIIESDIVPVKRVMTDFIRALSPDDEVAIVFPGHSNLSLNVTRDRARLLKTVDRVREALGMGLDAMGRSTTSDLVAGDGRWQLRLAREADFTLKNVALSLMASTYPRKAIVYVTGGSIVPTIDYPGGRPSDYPELQDAYATARRANVPIYTLDPRGMPSPESAVRGGIGSIGSSGMRSGAAANIRQQQERLSEIAINTGGRAFTNQSNLTSAVEAIVADNGSYYLLGYYPTPFEADGKFHTFDVRVKRPGVRVRGRTGYVASSAAMPVAEAASVLDSAMAAGVNVSAIALRAVAVPALPGDQGMRTAVGVEVTYPPRADGIREIADDLTMNVIALDPDAKIKASSGRVAHVAGTVPDRQPLTFFIEDAIELPAQPLTLRIGVASRVLGIAGTVQMPIDVPRADGKLQLGGIAIGRAGDAPGSVDSDSPIEGLLPFRPTTARAFSGTDTLRVFARAFWRSKETSVSLSAHVVGASGPAIDQPAVPSSGAGDRHEAALDGVLALTGLAPGAHVLQVEARLAGGQTARREVPFEIR